MLQFHPSNPFRPTSWRWEYARFISEKETKVTTKLQNDEYSYLAYKLHSGLAKCKDDVDRWDLMEQYPDLYAAYLIFRRGADEERHPLRYAIEARLLSGQDLVEIAQLTGISKDTVVFYEKVFFNVLEKLRNNDYIMTCVLGPSVHAGITDRDYDLLWKLFGYIYGPIVLDAFITTTSRRYRPETLAEVDAALVDDTRSSIQRKAAVVARTFTVNPFSQSELLNTYMRFLEMEKDAGNEKSHDVILQNIQVMMDKLPFSTGANLLESNKLAVYDSNKAELRTDELLSLSVGHELSNKEEFELYKFPEKDDGTN